MRSIALIAGLPYDTKKDLAAISLIGTATMAIATPVTSPYKVLGDVVTDLKANKPVSYGTIGNGSLGHLAMTLLGKSNGLDWQRVPYKGGGPMMQDAVGGHVPLVIGSVFVIKPHIDSGRVRPLAVTTARRSRNSRMCQQLRNRDWVNLKRPPGGPCWRPRRRLRTSLRA